MNFFTVLIFTLNFYSYGNDKILQVPLEYNTHELKIADSEISKRIFKTLPNKHYEASLVGELLIKNHRYFYCVREPDGEYNCYLYLNFKYDGSLGNFEVDHNYGLGSLVEFYGSKSILKDKAELNIKDNFIELYMEGKIAKKLYEKTDLGVVSFKRINDVDIEIRVGRQIKCLKSYDPNKKSFEAYGCKMKIAIDPNQQKDIFIPNLN